jgi:hypothetical protein
MTYLTPPGRPINSELPMKRIAGAGLRKRILRIWPSAFRAYLYELSGPGVVGILRIKKKK